MTPMGVFNTCCACATIWIALTATGFALDVEAFSGGKDLYAVPTFECIGIYFKADEASECTIHYRKTNDPAWQQGLSLVYDARQREYRGSVVGLESGTEYDIRLECGVKNASLSSRTKSEQFPIGKTTYLEDGSTSEIIDVTESGTPDAYHLITPRDGANATIDVHNAVKDTAIVNANYVILRGIELKNAARHGILVAKKRHDIVIEDCRITFWGGTGGPLSAGNTGGMDSAVFAEEGTGNLIIQRNLIEHPRGAANDWDAGHPSGPQAITLNNSSGGNIIRYNEIRASEDHGFSDAIGGRSNYSAAGCPNRDSDIYGNFIRNVWDDAIESDGANMNVRIWGNYTDLTVQFVSSASTTYGPLYVFRNVWHRSRRSHRDSIGGAMMKTGERGEFKGGRRYVFHNTALQPGGALHAFTGSGIGNNISRNNVFDCRGQLTGSRPVEIPSDHDYDYFVGMQRGIAKELHGVRQRWRGQGFAESYNLEFYPSATINKTQWGKIPVDFSGEVKIITDPVVTVRNPIIDAGIVIPGFNDDYSGEAPDLGAFELGRPPLKFGRRAGGTVWAPWELK
jgi:hypothetical protein